MGGTRLDRELTRARTAHVAAALRLHKAMEHLYELGVPIFTRTPEPWTAEQVRAVIAAQAAWTDLVATRRPYDRLCRECQRGGW